MNTTRAVELEERNGVWWVVVVDGPRTQEFACESRAQADHLIRVLQQPPRAPIAGSNEPRSPAARARR